MSTSDDTPQSPRPAFVTTQWTRVLEARGASPEAKAALSDLCAAYYAPVFAFIRRDGVRHAALMETPGTVGHAGRVTRPAH